MFTASVVVGRPYKTTEGFLPEDMCPPPGYNAVIGEVKKKRNRMRAAFFDDTVRFLAVSGGFRWSLDTGENSTDQTYVPTTAVPYSYVVSGRFFFLLFSSKVFEALY